MALIEPRLSDPRTGAMPEGIDVSSPPPGPPMRDAQLPTDADAEAESLAMLGDMSSEGSDLGPGSAGGTSRLLSGTAMALQGVNFIAQEAPILVTPILLQELEKLKMLVPQFIAERQQMGGGMMGAMMQQNPLMAAGGGGMGGGGMAPAPAPAGDEMTGSGIGEDEDMFSSGRPPRAF